MSGAEDSGSDTANVLESGPIQVLAHEILDDLVTNIVYDIVHTAYRKEKVARANTIAIKIEQQAAIQSTADPSESESSNHQQTPQILDTPIARYDDGEVYLKGNPMHTVAEPCCPRCGLPAIMDPTDGIGAVPLGPDDNITQYCSRHPYISKAGHDIYGNPFPTEDYKVPRKSIKLKSTSNPTSQPDSSIDPPSQEPKEDKTKSFFPTTPCTKCKRPIAIRDFRKHLMACMGISSRASGRTAAVKASSSFQNTPSSPAASPAPLSRKGTPKITTASFSERLGPLQKDLQKRTSPTKRLREYSTSPSPDLSSAYEDDEPPPIPAPAPVSSSAKKNKLLAEITDFLPLPVKPKVPTIKLNHNSTERRRSFNSSGATASLGTKSHVQNGHKHSGHESNGGTTGGKTSAVVPKKAATQGGFNGMMGQVGSVKKWKSGNVTLDGKPVDREQDRRKG